jgi:hypothetical protein
MLLRGLLLAFLVTAIPVAAEAVVGDGEGEKDSLVGSVLQGEESASDTDTGGDLPGLIRTNAAVTWTTACYREPLPSACFRPLVVIHQATRAPPLL